MGINKRSRRAAKRRLKKKKNPSRYARTLRRIEPIDDYGVDTADPALNPFEYVYYDDEPDFMIECERCSLVSGVPAHAMLFRQEWLDEYGVPDVDPEIHHSCPSCGLRLLTPARVERAKDGRAMYIIDRRAMMETPISETAADVTEVTLENDGVRLKLLASSGSDSALVVCDDCGLPFTTRIPHAAIISAVEAPVDVALQAGPCEHCGGFGSHLQHQLNDGKFITATATRDFAENMLELLADDLRSGKIDVGSAARAVRGYGGGPYVVLADWLDANPVNALLASTILGAVSGFIVNQIPPVLNPPDTTPQQTPQRRTFTEEEMTDLVRKLLSEYDRKAKESRRDD